jgi:hypothetical protein
MSMALVECKECGRRISRTAPACSGSVMLKTREVSGAVDGSSSTFFWCRALELTASLHKNYIRLQRNERPFGHASKGLFTGLPR